MRASLRTVQTVGWAASGANLARLDRPGLHRDPCQRLLAIRNLGYGPIRHGRDLLCEFIRRVSIEW